MAEQGVFSVPAFRWLWAATAVSAAGTFVGTLAVAFTVVETLHASAGAVAALAVAQQFTALVSAPIAGVLADRWPRLPLMVGADTARALALLAVPVLHHTGRLAVWQLALVSVVSGAANVVFNSAYQGLLPSLVDRARLVRANGAMGATVSVAEIGGFAAAGLLAHWLGPPNAVAVDAASFVASALFLTLIVSPTTARARGAHRPPITRRDVLAGMELVRHEPVLRSLLVTAALNDMGTAFAGVAYLLYLSGVVGFDDGLLGVIFAVGGVAALAGARLAQRAERRSSVGRAYVLSGAVRMVGSAAMPAAAGTGAVGVSLLLANQVVTDPAWMLQEVAEASIRQARTPIDLAGRVAALGQWTGNAARLAGTVAAGGVGEVWGPRAVLWCGCGLLGIAALVAATSAVRTVTTAGGATGHAPDAPDVPAIEPAPG